MHLPKRRQLLKASALALAAPAVLRRPALADGKAINVAAYGGVVNDQLTKFFAEPFAKETGIKVTFGAGTSLALAKLQTMSGGPAQWDIINLTGSEIVQAAKEKLIVPYDYSIIDASHVPPEYKEKYGIKFSLFLFVMCWDRKKIPDDKAPKTWAEFWDTKRWPGKRSMDANISDGSTLELALLADGVPLHKLFPLDVERALKSLDKLGRDNIVWYNTNQEPIQQLTSGAVSLATAFHGRVLLADKAGASLGFTPDYAGVSGNYYCVSAASANKTEAFKFLNYMLTDVKGDVEYMKATAYAIPNTAALPQLPKDIYDILPTNPALKDKVFIKSDAWWAANLDKTVQRFKEWQIGG
ncbi:MAG TPA: extracellular solute-binding protein [Rhodopila sp.]|uniref:extracellular solute-binding protein n=1 Tax=Rhodopila sp. TaxID=2480087 RepID=UPI002B977A00|nr:extracellular solute-binding protein [Rhodopila sp.]HVY18231.1 extracellular solute-binding protein [Rhodopila sp.]